MIDLAEANISSQKIAAMMNISRRTVQRWRRRYEDTETLENTRRCGSPRRTTRQEDDAILHFASQNPHMTAVQIKENIQLKIGPYTVRKRLREAGLQHQAAAANLGLSQSSREERLGFALEYLPAEATFWEKVVFCDGKTFASDRRGRLHSWSHNSTR